MKFIQQNPVYFSSTYLMICLLSFLVGCDGCSKSSHPPGVTLAVAEKEVEELLKLLEDPHLQDIRENWKNKYEYYFWQATHLSDPQVKEFAKHSLQVAEYPLKLIDSIANKTTMTRWSLITQTRTLVDEATRAIVLLEKGAENCLKDTEEEMAAVKGGCNTGACPFISTDQVKPENEKLKLILACNQKVFAKIKQYNEQAYQIAQKACEVAKEAENKFKENTDDYAPDKMKEKGVELMQAYAKSLAMLTIALKEVYQSHPIIKYAYAAMEEKGLLKGNTL